MSRMKPHCKPPLAKSPIRLRPRRALGSDSNSNCMQTPASRSEIRFEHTDQKLAGGSFRKPEKGRRTGTWEMEEAEGLRPEYGSISWEMRALEKMVGDELGKEDFTRSHLFERGRFYEEYSARRNERLNRKKKMIGSGGTNNSTTTSTLSASKYNYNGKLGVTVESGKRKGLATSTTTCGSTRKLQSLRRSVSAAYTAVESQRTMTTSQCETPAPAPAPRYMLRSLMKNKENQKPPLPQPHTSAIRGGRKIGAPSQIPRVGYY